MKLGVSQNSEESQEIPASQITPLPHGGNHLIRQMLESSLRNFLVLFICMCHHCFTRNTLRETRENCFFKRKSDKYKQTNKQSKKPRDDHHTNKSDVLITTLYGRIQVLIFSAIFIALVFMKDQLVRYILCKNTQYKTESTSVEP